MVAENDGGGLVRSPVEKQDACMISQASIVADDLKKALGRKQHQVGTNPLPRPVDDGGPDQQGRLGPDVYRTNYPGEPSVVLNVQPEALRNLNANLEHRIAVHIKSGDALDMLSAIRASVRMGPT